MSVSLKEKLHRTWIEVLIRDDFAECAALIIDAELEFFSNHWDTIEGLFVYLDLDNHQIIQNNDSIKNIISEKFNFIAQGHIWPNMSRFPIIYRATLLEVEENWQRTMKYLIINSKELNQGLITEKAFKKKGQKTIIYNEIKFASQAEVRIAQELEVAGVLFFPLPLAVRYETGNIYEDHREVDFLVCLQGIWGILEVSYHQGRYEKDKEKDAWFKKAGVLCVEHYTAEKCYNHPKTVVNEFLDFLAKFKR